MEKAKKYNEREKPKDKKKVTRQDLITTKRIRIPKKIIDS